MDIRRTPTLHVVAPLWFTALVALIAPVAALGGVVVGQRMQRETTERQLAEQRRRDVELWAREDKHRFSSAKRVLYAELLTSAGQYQRLVSDMVHKTYRYIEDFPAKTGKEIEPEDRGRFLIKHEFSNKIFEAATEFSNLRNQVSLVATGRVQQAAERFASALEYANLTTQQVWTDEEAHRQLMDAHDEMDLLKRAMRADLGEESEDFPVETHSA